MVNEATRQIIENIEKVENSVEAEVLICRRKNNIGEIKFIERYIEIKTSFSSMKDTKIFAGISYLTSFLAFIMSISAIIISISPSSSFPEYFIYVLYAIVVVTSFCAIGFSIFMVIALFKKNPYENILIEIESDKLTKR